MNKPTVHYDPKSDTLYLLVREGYEEEFVEVAEGIGVELGEDGQLLGIEILNASRFLDSIAKARRQAQEIGLGTPARQPA